jgi:hypothetical protein
MKDERVLDLLTGIVAQAPPPATDPWKPLAAPAAVVAVITLLSYAVGLIRPVAIRQAWYWTTGTGAGRITELSCQVQNRKVNNDRTLTGLALIRVPPLGHRLLHWRWRQDLTDHDAYVLLGNDITEIGKGNVKIAKRDQRALRCKIHGPDGRALRPDEELPKAVRLLAYFGSSRPAAARPKLRGVATSSPAER